MAHEDPGWRPEGGLQEYKGYEVWDYSIGPHELNPGKVDPDFELDVDPEDDE